eukprot:1154367-Pelagomonas_calceolata.AAC.4
MHPSCLLPKGSFDHHRPGVEAGVEGWPEQQGVPHATVQRHCVCATAHQQHGLPAAPSSQVSGQGHFCSFKARTLATRELLLSCCSPVLKGFQLPKETSWPLVAVSHHFHGLLAFPGWQAPAAVEYNARFAAALTTSFNNEGKHGPTTKALLDPNDNNNN